MTRVKEQESVCHLFKGLKLDLAIEKVAFGVSPYHGLASMKAIAIVNPAAGSRRAPYVWPGLLSQLGARASQVVTWWTEGPGHAEFLAGQAKRIGLATNIDE